MYIFEKIGMIKMATEPGFHRNTSTLQMYFNGHLDGDLEEIGVIQYSCTTLTAGGFVDLNC